jgi:hypothetical protein
MVLERRSLVYKKENGAFNPTRRLLPAAAMVNNSISYDFFVDEEKFL